MAVVKKYKSVVVSIENSVPDVYTIEFRSLSGKYKYQPGQFLHLAIDSDYDGTDQWPESRCFSMQSNPDEEIIRITYAVKGSFTKKMEKLLRVGTEVWLKLPYGDFFLRPHNKVNTVFIAGGTGITPFLSLFTHHTFTSYINPLIFIGFKSPDYNIYCKELKEIRNATISIKYETIDGPLAINKIIAENGPNQDYFVSGPIRMINYFKNYLITSGISPFHIHLDDWE